jgi:hypothetical protein
MRCRLVKGIGSILPLVAALASTVGCKSAETEQTGQTKSSLDIPISPGEHVLGYGIKSFEENRLKNNCLVNKDGSSVVNGVNQAALLKRVRVSDPGSWVAFVTEVSEKKNLAAALELSFQASLASEGLSGNIAGALAEGKVSLVKNTQFQSNNSYTLIRIQYKRTEEALDPDQLMIEEEYRVKVPLRAHRAKDTNQTPGSGHSSETELPAAAPMPPEHDAGAEAIGRLLKDCGDMYLESYASGGEFVGLVESKTRLFEQSTTNGQSANVGATAGPVKISSGAEAKEILSQLNGSSVTNAWIVQVGGCFLGSGAEGCNPLEERKAAAQAPEPAKPGDSKDLKGSKDKAPEKSEATKTTEEIVGAAAKAQTTEARNLEQLVQAAGKFVETVEQKSVILSGHFESYDRFFRSANFFAKGTDEEVMTGYERQFSTNQTALKLSLGQSWVNILLLKQLVNQAIDLQIESRPAGSVAKVVLDTFEEARATGARLYDTFIDVLWEQCYLHYENCIVRDSNRVLSPIETYKPLVSWVKLEASRRKFYEASSAGVIEVSRPGLRTAKEFSDKAASACIAVAGEGLIPTFALNQEQIANPIVQEKIREAARAIKGFDFGEACFWVQLPDWPAEYFPGSRTIKRAGTHLETRQRGGITGILYKPYQEEVDDSCYEVCGNLPAGY